MTPTLSSGWYDALTAVIQDGISIAPTKGPALEYPGVFAVEIEMPQSIILDVPGREFRHVIGALEGLSLVGQVSIAETFIDRVAAFRPFVRHSIFWGVYGPRAVGSIGQIATMLAVKPDSRQAVISLYNSKTDLGRPEEVDVPCTLTIQFKVRRQRLEMWVAMRSNDVWLGLPYDLMQFAMLQAAIAQHLGIPAGPYTHTAGSMHLYDRHSVKAQEVYRSGSVEGWNPTVMDSPVWGGSGDISETASRARRILLGEEHYLDNLTEFEKQMVQWLIKF